MKQGELFVAVSPREMGLGKKGREVQMIYRLGAGFRLYQASVCTGVRQGQLMGIDTGETIPLGEEDYFVGQVMAQLRLHGYGGLCCWFPTGGLPALGRGVSMLAEACAREGYLCLLPEAYGDLGESNGVLVSTALSGGDLEGRFRSAMEKYGRHRVVMELEGRGEDFLIPSPQGCGEKKSVAEIHALALEKGAQVFFSKELCGRYFTYENGERSLRFVLYDDSGTAGEKLRLAKIWKIAGVLGRYEEMESWRLL